ncbi:uncharacterized protein FTJAE_11044 [Fusarium tjaetaba]|uniref:N-acetyltransferase domain-containing protein n=1 Tax=Fusarium tjaetaba TaxID=1567544 RepID=A0A8H5QVI4_9HYPO|nr:uncharacterized protein FTJAE_11044 [Fusarium tjaetaba]KAF5622077.1 hypothetical protein FTJAE_11044 [Fusarium tjaetaba]
MDIASVTKAFQSERLIYRSPEDNDKDKEFFFKHIENDPVAKALADPSVLRPRNKKGVEDFLTEFQKSTLAVVLCLSPTEAKTQNIESEEPVPIGFICIGWGGKRNNMEQHRATHIGIVIAEPFRNKGYGGESINWALDWAFRRWWDMIDYGMLEHEWEALRAKEKRDTTMSNLRCALCGITIPCAHPSHADQQQRVWWREIFAVKREEDQSHFSLTPLGYSQDGSLQPHPVIQPNEGYFIHQACWPIYRDKMFLESGRRYENEQILQVLFDFIQSMPRNRDGWISYLCPVNEPAVYLATFPGDYYPRCDFLKADPSISVTPPASCPLVDGGTYGVDDTETSLDLFSKLSTELNHCIINLLDNVSLCNLRLASKAVANLSKPTELPQTFWASRFNYDREMDFFPTDYKRTETWRDLYFNVKDALRDTSSAGHMTNRRRIWWGLGMITPYLIAMLDQRPRLDDTTRLREELVSLGYEMTQKVQGFGGDRGANPSGDIHVRGSRYLKLRLGGARISVTRAYIDGRDYITGFRVTRRDHTERFRIGLINTYEETRFVIKPSDQVIALKVATTFGGIVGLAFRIKDELGGVDWKIVGKVDKPDDYVGTTLLKPQNGPYISGLLLGLDACKVVSIQLVEKLRDATAVDKRRSLGQQHVWHPAPPQPDVVTKFTPTVNEEPAFILNMDFGGPSGSLLPLLTRAALFVDDINHTVKGLGFYYTDGTEREFGFREIVSDSRQRLTAIELSVPIDGAAGERIVGLYAMGRWSFRVRMIPSYGSLQSFGLVHLDHPDSSQPQWPSPARKRYKGHPGPSNSVCLNNVKRVGISCGREGRSRRPEQVSGFHFEFWDNSRPVYVGQWFKEIGHLDVCEGERITSFTFWNELVGCTYHNGRYAKYSGVRIQKSGPEPNAVEVHPGPHRDMHESSHTENRFERLDSIVWQVFHMHDTTIIAGKPTPLAKRCLSTESHIREELCTKSDKMFWEIEDGKGGWTSVSQIAAFFNPDTKGLCGMEFTYKDNQIRRGGYTEGTKTTYKLKRYEKVTGAWITSSTTNVSGDIRDVSCTGIPNARRVPGGESECVGVYLEMWPDLKDKTTPARLANTLDAGFLDGVPMEWLAEVTS